MIDRNYVLGVVAIIVSVLYPTIIGWNNYRSSRKVDREKLGLLLSKFNFAREFTAEVKEKLKTYAEVNQVLDVEFVQKLTYRQCINVLEEAEAKLLNDSVYSDIRSLKKIPVNYEGLVKGLETHIKHTGEVNTLIKLYLTDGNG